MYQGFPHRENFLTGTAAAARGGITTVIDMPCCSVPSAKKCRPIKTKNRFSRASSFSRLMLCGVELQGKM